MSLADLTTKISADAQAHAERIIEEATKRAQEIQKETSDKLSARRDRFNEELEKLLVENVRHVDASARQEVKLIHETTRRALVDKVFTDALAELTNAPSETYLAYMDRMLDRLPPGLTGTVSAPKERLGGLIAHLSARGHDLKGIEDESIRTGCVISGEDFEFDLTLEKLIAEERPDLEILVANTLFSQS